MRFVATGDHRHAPLVGFNHGRVHHHCTLAGLGSYLYSIDGGQHFEASGVFDNLPVGDYNIVVTDNFSDCIYEFERLLMPIGVDAVEDESSLSPIFRVFPNPTASQLHIELTSPSTMTQAVPFVVFDHLGRVMEVGRISQGSSQETVWIGDYARGAYFVQCIGEGFEYVFKVIKM